MRSAVRTRRDTTLQRTGVFDESMKWWSRLKPMAFKPESTGATSNRTLCANDQRPSFPDTERASTLSGLRATGSYSGQSPFEEVEQACSGCPAPETAQK